MADIGIKFCGGCNPLIDRARLAAEVEQLLGPGNSLVMVPSSSVPDVAVLICGCETACAGGPHVTGPRGPARKWVLVAGPSVDYTKIPEKELAGVIAERLRAIQAETEAG